MIVPPARLPDHPILNAPSARYLLAAGGILLLVMGWGVGHRLRQRQVAAPARPTPTPELQASSSSLLAHFERQSALVEFVRDEIAGLQPSATAGNKQLSVIIDDLFQMEESYNFDPQKNQSYYFFAEYNQKVGELIAALNTEYLEELIGKTSSSRLSELKFQLEGTQNTWVLLNEQLEHDLSYERESLSEDE